MLPCGVGRAVCSNDRCLSITGRNIGNDGSSDIFTITFIPPGGPDSFSSLLSCTSCAPILPLESAAGNACSLCSPLESLADDDTVDGVATGVPFGE